MRLARPACTGHSSTGTTSFVPRAKWPMTRPPGPRPKTKAAFCRKRQGMPSPPTGIPIAGRTRGAPLPIDLRSSTSRVAVFFRSCSGYAMCCQAQPPHAPAWRQRGTTRLGDASSTSTIRARAGPRRASRS